MYFTPCVQSGAHCTSSTLGWQAKGSSSVDSNLLSMMSTPKIATAGQIFVCVSDHPAMMCTKKALLLMGYNAHLCRCGIKLNFQCIYPHMNRYINKLFIIHTRMWMHLFARRMGWLKLISQLDAFKYLPQNDIYLRLHVKAPAARPPGIHPLALAPLLQPLVHFLSALLVKHGYEVPHVRVGPSAHTPHVLDGEQVSGEVVLLLVIYT
jgi:hypothetical protein